MKLCLLVLLLTWVFLHTNSQTVDCIKWINSTYGTPSSCTSTTNENRPINATAVVKATKNTTWYGPNDWNPYLVRNNYIILDLYAISSCFPAEPVKQTWVSGRYYELSVKCVLIPVTLQKGDLIYFELFQSHKTA